MNRTDQYLGNPNLKKGHTKSRFTKKQIEEVIKCLDDPKYFISTYLKIVTIDKGLVPFKMYDFQETMIVDFPLCLGSLQIVKRFSWKVSTIVR